MTGVQLLHIPQNPTVHHEQILCKRGKRLVLFGVNIHPAAIVALVSVVSWSRGSIEGDERLTVDLIRGCSG